MRKIMLGLSGLEVPTIAVGCMRINGLEKKELHGFLNTALENGANFFDHANVYGGGECESLFGQAMGEMSLRREDIIIQTKCGIKQVGGSNVSFDFSYEHIVSEAEKSLKRLGTDYIDVLLLHRPDTLMEPEEVARAFSELKATGKVRHFGVSNQKPGMIELLKKYCPMPIAANQMQLSIAVSSLVTQGIHTNTASDFGIERDGGLLEYCRLNDITIQPWSPMQYGFFEGTFLGSPKYPELNAVLERLAEKYSISPTGMAIAWLLRHPAKMQPVTGTTNARRLLDCINAADVAITREEWYEIWKAAGNFLP